MQLDPSKWFIFSAGFVYDWILTREWTRVLVALAPAALLAGLAVAVWWGRTLDSNQLAQWYMEQGEEEIKDWEDSWAGGATESLATEDDVSESMSDATGDGPDAEEAGDDGQTPKNDNGSGQEEAKEERAKISPYADMLFRRVQKLVPSDRSQFYIAMSMLQQGATEQGLEMLAEIAPAEGVGFPQAHAFYGLLRMREMTSENARQMWPEVRNHILQAQRSNRVPIDLLKSGSDLFWMMADLQQNPTQREMHRSTSLKLLNQAAEVEPALQLALARRAKSSQNVLVEQGALPKAEKHYRQSLADNPDDDDVRVRLAEVLILQDNLDEAEQMLLTAHQLKPTPKTARGLSEIYRYRFNKSIQEQNGVFAGNIRLLDRALSVDPTNPLVAEDIAKLARINSPSANDAMVAKLREFLAAGTATAVTHRWLAEAYLLRGEQEKAVKHLEQVVNRLPNEVDSLNNLAYVLAQLYPERMDEALAYSQRAIAQSGTLGKPNADYYDTLGMIYASKGETPKAITAYETAIQLAPLKIEFHREVAKQYRLQGDVELAENHEKRIQQIQESEAEKAAEAEALGQQPGETADQVGGAQAAILGAADGAAPSNSPSSDDSSDNTSDDVDSAPQTDTGDRSDDPSEEQE